MYDIAIRDEDGRRASLDKHIDDLGEACAYVLKLADEFGIAADDGDKLPQWVEIYRDGRLEISVSVVRGGLIKKDA